MGGLRMWRGVAAGLFAMQALVWCEPATAQISAPSASSAGSTCSDGNATDRFCGFSAAVDSNDGTTLVTRYAWNVNADSPSAGSATQGGTAVHGVAFDVTAAGGYRLDIATQRRGDMNVVAEGACLPSTADIGAVTGNSNRPLASGTLNMPDPGVVVSTTSTSTAIDQAAAATLFGVSNGSPVAHTLDFTWSGTILSESCEAAVRLGEQNGSTLNCPGCEYPGNPARTQADDGHVVTVTLTSLCGNGVIDAEVAEECDQGAANGTSTSCCTATCTFRTIGSTCRPVAGGCDIAEVCTGSSGACPADGFEPNGVLCRASVGVCDVDDFCTGTSAACTDTTVAPGTECRAAAGICDVAEACNGSPLCPSDSFQSAATICRPSVGPCDLADTCTGSGASCPADAKSTGECRPAADLCDAAEVCDGVNDTCPGDAIAPAGTVCRAAGGVCDIEETCDGATTACPADAKSTAECRAAVDVCDVAETCDGVNDACPADALAAAGTECRASTAACDAAETCTGTDAGCPTDSLHPAGHVCRPENRPCDIAETCDGVGLDCPADLDTDMDDDTICDPVDLCPSTPDMDQADGDTDGVGDACDPCTNLFDVFASKAKLKLTKQSTPPGDDALKLSGTLEGLPTSPPLDPATQGIRVLVEDVDGTAVLDTEIPGGEGWKTNKKGTSWRWSSTTGIDGIRKVNLKSSGKRPDRVKVKVNGKDGAFAVPADKLPVSVAILFTRPLASGGECGEALFDTGGCALNRKGTTVKCR